MSSAFKYLALLIFIIILLPLDHCKQNITDEFIIEYFRYRAPSTVVGFTCDQYESKKKISSLYKIQVPDNFAKRYIFIDFSDDVQLIKKFSDVKLQSLIWKLEDRMDISSLAKALYRRLGVFIDLRCQFSENVRIVFNEVKLC